MKALRVDYVEARGPCRRRGRSREKPGGVALFPIVSRGAHTAVGAFPWGLREMKRWHHHALAHGEREVIRINQDRLVTSPHAR